MASVLIVALLPMKFIVQVLALVVALKDLPVSVEDAKYVPMDISMLIKTVSLDAEQMKFFKIPAVFVLLALVLELMAVVSIVQLSPAASFLKDIVQYVLEGKFSQINVANAPLVKFTETINVLMLANLVN